jgi:hypothetical protein
MTMQAWTTQTLQHPTLAQEKEDKSRELRLQHFWLDL